MQNRWLLPEAIGELLPPAAQELETLRRQILDCYKSWGYQLIMPPVVEFLDALLTGVGSELDTQTFKLTDRATGRLMGVRADMTPQAARIDAHQLNHNAVNRLCYFGTVLRTQADGLGGSRNPLQVGAELFGSQSLDADIEVAALLMETLSIIEAEAPILDIGHVDVLTALMQAAELSEPQQSELFDLLQRKALPDLKAYAEKHGLTDQQRDWFKSIAELNGPVDQFSEIVKALGGQLPAVDNALTDMQRYIDALQARCPGVQLHYDLAELNGYSYQTGIVFSAFVAGVSRAVARGGRYDGIGGAFGKASPATGFSLDIKSLLLNRDNQAESVTTYIAVDSSDPAEVARLRKEGHIVVGSLSDQEQQGQPV